MDEPQYVIVKATFAPTGQVEPVPKFGEPMVLPDVREILINLGWLDPVAAEQMRDVVEVLTDRVAHHHYLSTSCYHDRPELHLECQLNETRWDGTPKIAAQCKVCGSGCVCPCHR